MTPTLKTEHNENHNLEKRCKIEGCNRLGSPSTCKDCGKKSRRSHCPKHRKIKNRPTLEELLLNIEKIGYANTGKKYNVSDNSIRKWVISYGVEPPKKHK